MVQVAAVATKDTTIAKLFKDTGTEDLSGLFQLQQQRDQGL